MLKMLNQIESEDCKCGVKIYGKSVPTLVVKKKVPGMLNIKGYLVGKT